MPDFSVRHPYWQQRLSAWKRNEDFYRAGQHVINTPRPVGRVHRVHVASEQTSTGIESEAGRPRVMFVPEDVSSYIQSHVREYAAEFHDRVSRGMHFPLFRSLVDIYTSAALRQEPSVEGQANVEPYSSYRNDADGCGTPFAEFRRRAVTLSLVYPGVFCVTDRPRFDSPARSAAEALYRGDRPYSYLVSPIDVVDWEVDRYGRLLWIVIREDAPADRAAGQPHKRRRDQYRVWTRGGWALWREPDSDRAVGDATWIEVDGGEYGFDEIPVEPLFPRRIHEQRHTLECDGVLEAAVDIDRSLLNQMSLLHEQLYGHTFNSVWLPQEDGVALPNVEWGVNRVNAYNPADGGKPLFMAPDASILEIQWRLVMETVQMARQMFAVTRGRAEYSKEERSAAALDLESQDKYNTIASLVGQIEHFDRAVHRHVALWMGQDVGSAPRATYSRKVSLRSLGERIDELLKLASLQATAAAVPVLARPVIEDYMRDSGQPDDVIDGVRGLLAATGVRPQRPEAA